MNKVRLLCPHADMCEAPLFENGGGIRTGSWGFGLAERGGPSFQSKKLIWVMRFTQPCISAAGRVAVCM